MSVTREQLVQAQRDYFTRNQRYITQSGLEHCADAILERFYVQEKPTISNEDLASLVRGAMHQGSLTTTLLRDNTVGAALIQSLASRNLKIVRVGDE